MWEADSEPWAEAKGAPPTASASPPASSARRSAPPTFGSVSFLVPGCRFLAGRAVPADSRRNV